MTRAIFLFALVLGILCTASCEESSYNSGYQDGHAAGHSAGYSDGYSAANPAPDIGLSKGTRKILEGGAALGALVFFGALLISGIYIIARGVNLDSLFDGDGITVAIPAVGAKILAAIAGLTVAMVVEIFTPFGALMHFAFVTPAWSNRLGMLLVIVVGAALGYFIISFMKFFATLWDSFTGQAWGVFFIAVVGTSFVTAFARAMDEVPTLSNYMVCYILFGVLIGALAYGSKVLLGVANGMAAQQKSNSGR
jgi:hypothetical protein